VGVIGVGHLGASHARVLRALAGATLVGVHDLLPERADAVAAAHGVRAFPDAAALLREVEAVTVAVPTPAHEAVAIEALSAGVHVLVEKPIASSLEEADRMLEASLRAGRLLAVGHIERFNPAVVAIRPFVRSPRFVEAHRLATFSLRGTDVDVVLDLMIHDIDLALSLVGSRVARVDAAGVGILTASEDIANARLLFENGCVANLTASRVSRERTRKIRFFQFHAYLAANCASGSAEVIELVEPPPGSHPLDLGARFRERRFGPGGRDALEAECAAFLAAAAGRDGARPATAAEGRDALAVALEIRRELRTARERQGLG
jgi:predicted dehydrogenase